MAEMRYSSSENTPQKKTKHIFTSAGSLYYHTKSSSSKIRVLLAFPLYGHQTFFYLLRIFGHTLLY